MEKDYKVMPYFNGLFDEDHICESLKCTGTNTKRVTLKDVKNFSWLAVQYSSQFWPAVQVFDAPMRVSDIHNHPEYWQYWNGCVFVDLDLKHMATEQRRYSVQYIKEKISDVLRQDKNLYAYQESRSRNGLHYIFYFEVEKSEINFKKCARIAQNRIRYAILSKMPDLFTDIEAYDSTRLNGKIVDDCSLTPTQLLIMTPYPLYRGHCLSDDDFGTIDFSELEPWELSDKELARAESTFAQDNGISQGSTIWSYNRAKWDGDYGGICWGEPDRFQLATFLFLIGMNETMADGLFYDMFKNGISGRKSNWWTIEKEFKQAWKGARKYQICKLNARYIVFAKDHLNILQYDKADAEQQQTDQQRLDEYIESHDGHKWPYMPFEADRTITLNDDEFIGNISERIEQIMKNALTEQVYIKAECGSGKTKYIISEFIKSRKAIIVCHLNSIKDSNYDNFLQTENSIEYVNPSLNDMTTLLNESKKLPHHLLLGWPQFAELLRKTKDLQDYIIYIDEAHALQYEYDYRYDHISSIVSNISKAKNLRLVSATPGAEHSLLLTDSNALRLEINKPITYTIEYFRVLNQDTNQCGNVVNTIADFIRDQYVRSNDVFAILDNRNHTKYDNLLDDLSYVRLCRDEANSDEIQHILNTQMLGKRILVSTNYGKEGIEYLDEIDDLVVLIPQYCDIKSHDVEQFINRFRRKKRVHVFFMQISLWTDNTDIELIKKGRFLVSLESAADERLPELLNDLNNRFIKDITKVDLATLIGNKSKEPLLRLITYNLDDILVNSIRFQKNLERTYPLIQQRFIPYGTTDIETSRHEEEKSVLSIRENVEKYLDVSLNLKGLIRQMRSDGLLNLRNDESNDDMIDRIDSFFSIDNVFVREDSDERLSDFDKYDRQKVTFMKKEVERIKDIIRLLNEAKRCRDVKLDDEAWSYFKLWRNRSGIINYRTAFKFAVQARDDDRGAAISRRQKVQYARDVKWMAKVVSRLRYMGKPVEYDANRGLSLKWGWIRWSEMTNEKSESEKKREKGSRVTDKFCTADGNVRFRSVEDMWKFAQAEYGYTGCLRQFRNKWKKMPWFKKL